MHKSDCKKMPNEDKVLDALRTLGALVDLVLDGGACKETQPSTIIDCTGARARLVREGAMELNQKSAFAPLYFRKRPSQAAGAAPVQRLDEILGHAAQAEPAGEDGGAVAHALEAATSRLTAERAD